MKTIAVIGANGRTGQEFVALALTKGYRVRAGVHLNSSFHPEKNLEVFKVDATHPAQVRKLIEGSDIVVSLLGHVRHSPKRVQTEAIKTILQEMQKLTITRIVSLTGTGVRFDGDTPSLLDIIANSSIKIIDRNRIQDGIDHAKILQESDLDWTLLRVLKLTNQKLSTYSLTAHGPARFFAPRKSVASALLDIVDSHEYTHIAPVLSRTQ